MVRSDFDPVSSPRHATSMMNPIQLTTSCLGLVLVCFCADVAAQTSVDPRGRSVLFIRGADGSGGLGNGSTQQRTEHLSDINNVSTQSGNHGFGELANLLRTDGFKVSQWIESQGFLTTALLFPHRIIVLASNNRVYAAAEVSAFHTYMDAGGSALFISDANWGSNFNAAPASDNQFLARYGLSMYQDSANGVPVISRTTAGRFIQPDYPALSGPDGKGGFDDVNSYEGEGVSYLHVERGSGGWVASVLVSATGFMVRKTTTNGQPGGLVAATSRDGAMVMAQKDDGLILGHFDRNTFFNRNGTGSDLTKRDNRQLALDIFRTLASVQARAKSVGSPCGRSGRTPSLIVGVPNLGRSVLWSVRGAAPNQVLGMLYSVGAPKPTTLPGGCVVQPDLGSAFYMLVGTTNGSGDFVTSYPLPRGHALSGEVLTAQMVIAAPGGPVFGSVELTGGVELRLGFAR